MWKSARAKGLCSSLYGGGWPVQLDRLDAGVASGSRLVHLTRTNDLVVRGLEVEVRSAVRRVLLFIALRERTVLLDRGNAVLSRTLALVLLAPEDDLCVARFQGKRILALLVA